MGRRLRGELSCAPYWGSGFLLFWTLLPASWALAGQDSTKESAPVPALAMRLFEPGKLDFPDSWEVEETPRQHGQSLLFREEALGGVDSSWVDRRMSIDSSLPLQMDFEESATRAERHPLEDSVGVPMDQPLGADLRIGEEPQQDTTLNKSSRKQPWFDFRHLELVPFGGLTWFSSAFKADLDWDAGALVYLPMPALPSGNYGLFGGLLLGNLDRKLNPSRSGEGGLYEMGLLGGYYTFYKNEGFFFRGGLGGAYVAYNGIAGLKDGPGGVVNLEFCLFSDANKPASGLTFSPLFITDGRQFLFPLVFGIWIKF